MRNGWSCSSRAALAQDFSTIDFQKNQALPLATLDYTYRSNGLGNSFADAFSQNMTTVRFRGRTPSASTSRCPLGNEAAEIAGAPRDPTRLQRLRRSTRDEHDHAGGARRAGRPAHDVAVHHRRQRSVVLSGACSEAERNQFEAGTRTSTEVLEVATKLAQAQIAEIRTRSWTTRSRRSTSPSPRADSSARRACVGLPERPEGASTRPLRRPPPRPEHPGHALGLSEDEDRITATVRQWAREKSSCVLFRTGRLRFRGGFCASHKNLVHSTHGRRDHTRVPPLRVRPERLPKTWKDSWLEGVCSECGYGFAWGEVPMVERGRAWPHRDS